jgi:hypothetical protein
MQALPSAICCQLSPSELVDILDGMELFVSLNPNEPEELAAFIEVSLLALGFVNGKRLN